MEYAMKYNLDAKEVEIANKILAHAPLKGRNVAQTALFWAVKLASIVDPDHSRAEELYERLGHCIRCESWAQELLRMRSSIDSSRLLELDEFLALKKLDDEYRRYSLDAQRSAYRAAEIVTWVVECRGIDISINHIVSRSDLSCYSAVDVLRKSYTALTTALTAKVRPMSL